MNVTEEQLTSVLTEALTGYLKTLEITHQLQESFQPRQGKGVEITADISKQQNFLFRTEAIQTCLRFVPRIASDVRKWANSGADAYPSAAAEAVFYNAMPGAFLEEFDEPFINPLTGKLVEPVTERSAGPSNRHVRKDRQMLFSTPSELGVPKYGSHHDSQVRLCWDKCLFGWF